MFTTREAVQERLGVEVTNANLTLAQTLVEAYVGRVEADVEDASDIAILGRAVQFQAVYMDSLGPSLLRQVGYKSILIGETTEVYDTERLAPYMSPWVVMVCKGLSWFGTRSIHTGPMYDRAARVTSWERD